MKLYFICNYNENINRNFNKIWKNDYKLIGKFIVKIIKRILKKKEWDLVIRYWYFYKSVVIKIWGKSEWLNRVMFYSFVIGMCVWRICVYV